MSGNGNGEALPGWPTPDSDAGDSISFYGNRSAAQAVREWRNRDDLSMAALARRAELDIAVIAAIEQGVLDQLIAALWPLSAAFDACPTDLLGVGPE